eukprot:974039-Prymnesium_polylepis.1
MRKSRAAPTSTIAVRPSVSPGGCRQKTDCAYSSATRHARPPIAKMLHGHRTRKSRSGGRARLGLGGGGIRTQSAAREPTDCQPGVRPGLSDPRASAVCLWKARVAQREPPRREAEGVRLMVADDTHRDGNAHGTPSPRPERCGSPVAQPRHRERVRNAAACVHLAVWARRAACQADRPPQPPLATPSLVVAGATLS